MKKSLLALAALTAFAGAASAQSSVTIGGIVDLAARSVKNGSAGSVRSLSSGGQATSRLYFRGVEDLGGGLKAGFWLESELVPDTGGSGSTVGGNGSSGTGSNVFWARRSTVSLMGGFGELRLGRDYTPTFNSFNAIEIFGYVGVASPANLRAGFYSVNTGGGSAVRQSNAISYLLPSMGGVIGQIQVSAGEGAANTITNAQNKSVSGRLGYGAGPLTLSASYAKINKIAQMTDDLTTFNAGGRFDFGFASIGGLYEESKYSIPGRQLKQKIATANLIVPFGASQIKAQYTKSGGPGLAATADQFNAKMFGLGYVYNLSKRTSVYANYGSINNGGSTTGGALFTASGSGSTTGFRRGETSSGYEFGVRHDF